MFEVVFAHLRGQSLLVRRLDDGVYALPGISSTNLDETGIRELGSSILCGELFGVGSGDGEIVRLDLFAEGAGWKIYMYGFRRGDSSLNRDYRFVDLADLHGGLSLAGGRFYVEQIVFKMAQLAPAEWGPLAHRIGLRVA